MTDTIVHCGISPCVLRETLHSVKEGCSNVLPDSSEELHDKLCPITSSNRSDCDEALPAATEHKVDCPTSPRYTHLVNLSTFDEVVIDGFSILSFRTKDDLMMYTRQSEVDRQSSHGPTADKLKSSRRALTTSRKRSKVHRILTAGEDADSPCATGDQRARAADILSSGIGFSSSSSSPEKNHENRVPSIGSNLHDFSSKRNSPQPYIDESSGDCGPSCSLNYDELSSQHLSSPATYSVPDNTVAQSSSVHSEPLFTGSVLSSALNCHLVPLATTWSHISTTHSSTSSVSNGSWPPTDVTDHKSHLMSVEATFPRNEPGPELGRLLISRPSPVSVAKSKSCHQFSVAALTDEPTTTTAAFSSTHHSVETKSAKISNRAPRRSYTKRAAVQRTLHSTLIPGFSPHSTTHLLSSTSSGLISGSPIPTTTAGFRTQLTVSHRDNQRQCFIPDHTAGKYVAVERQTSSVTSSPVATTQSRSHVFSKTSESRGWNSPACSLPDSLQAPDPRVLQQLIGIDAEAAERLLSNTRFNDLYSLTLATLARGGANGIDTRKPMLRNGSTEMPRDGTLRIGDSVASANTYVSATSSPLANKSSTSPIVPHHTKRISTSDGHDHETPVINFGPSSDLHPGHTQALLHNAYNDRELVSRLSVSHASTRKMPPPLQSPSRDTSPTYAFSSLSHSSSLLSHYLPPPPLIAGCAQPDQLDLRGFPRTTLLSDLPHRPHFPSSYITSPRPTFSRTSPPVNSLPMLTSIAPPEPAHHSNHKQLENLVRGKLPSMATCSSSSVGVGPPNRSIKGRTSMPTKGPPIVVTVSDGSMQTRISFESGTSQNLVSPPPPYHALNPLRLGPLVRPPPPHRPTLDSRTNGAPEQTKRQLVNLLRQPVHKCGHWADAHVRIARFIDYLQLLSGSRVPHDDFTNTGSATSCNPRYPIRPVPRPPPPILPRFSGSMDYPVLPPPIPTSQLSSLIAPPRIAPNSNPASDIRSHQTMPSASSKLMSGRITDGNSLLTSLFGGMLSNMSAGWTKNSDFFSKEMSEMLWNSTFQKLYGQSIASQGPEQARPTWAINGSTPSILDLTHSTRDPLNTFFAAGAQLQPPDPPVLLAPPGVSTPASPHPSFSSTSSALHTGANTKRRRLEVSPLFHSALSHSPHLDLPLSQPAISLPFHSHISRPPDFLPPALQKATNQLNGCHLPDLSDRWNSTNPFIRMDTNYSENSLKLPAPPPHPAPIHPW